MRYIYLLFLTGFIVSNSACVQKTKKQTVNISIDCKHLNDINTISVRGGTEPLSWNKNYELIDNDKDSIFSGQIIFDIPFDGVELKFVKNEDEFELKNQKNRIITFDEDGVTDYSAAFDLKN